jgi:transcriptional regulator with XRE-family HTH domain
MFMNNLDFVDWVNDELTKRRIRRTELARIGGIDQGYVSHVLNKEQSPGVVFCQAVAKALNISEADVLWRAGIAREKPIGADLPGMYDVIEVSKKLTEDQRKQAVVLLELLRSGMLLVPTDDTKPNRSDGRKAKATIHLEAE